MTLTPHQLWAERVRNLMKEAMQVGEEDIAACLNAVLGAIITKDTEGLANKLHEYSLSRAPAAIEGLKALLKVAPADVPPEIIKRAEHTMKGVQEILDEEAPPETKCEL